jgi:hypothetical protein
MLIRTEADLLALMRPQSLLHPFRKPPVLLAIPQVPADENAAWADRLEYLRQECGCTAAVIGLGVFTLASFACVLAAALQTNPGIEPDYQVILFNAAWLVAGVILSALFGKLVGLTLAALRFRRTCRALLARLVTLQSGHPLTTLDHGFTSRFVEAKTRP